MPSERAGKSLFSSRMTWSAIATLTVVGAVLITMNNIVFDVKNFQLEKLVFSLLPVGIGVLAYSNVFPTASRWEVAIVAVWGFASAVFGGPLAYFVFGGLYEQDPSSIQLLSDNMFRFLFTSSLVSGIFMAAGHFRGHPLRSAGILLLAPLAWFLPFAGLFLFR